MLTGNPLGYFNIHSVAKYQKNEGEPFGESKNFPKTLLVPKKI